jgi:50S ribosomal subunit-associated GTPase HflX
MRGLYNKNKISKVSNEKQLTNMRSKHKHHVVVGAFKRIGSKKLYDEFQRTADKFNTLKFIDFTDTEAFNRLFIKNNHEW